MDFFGRWEVFAFGAAIFAGLTAFLGKVGVADINSNTATFIRTGIVLLITALIVLCTHQWQRQQAIPAKTWLFLGLSGIATALSWLCYYRALQLGPVSKVAAVDKLSVAVAIVLGVLILGEKFTWQAAVGAVLISAGAILIAL